MRKNGFIFGLAYLLGALSALGLGGWQTQRADAPLKAVLSSTPDVELPGSVPQPNISESTCETAASIACFVQDAQDQICNSSLMVTGPAHDAEQAASSVLISGNPAGNEHEPFLFNSAAGINVVGLAECSENGGQSPAIAALAGASCPQIHQGTISLQLGSTTVNDKEALNLFPTQQCSEPATTTPPIFIQLGDQPDARLVKATALPGAPVLAGDAVIVDGAFAPVPSISQMNTSIIGDATNRTGIWIFDAREGFPKGVTFHVSGAAATSQPTSNDGATFNNVTIFAKPLQGPFSQSATTSPTQDLGEVVNARPSALGNVNPGFDPVVRKSFEAEFLSTAIGNVNPGFDPVAYPGLANVVPSSPFGNDNLSFGTLQLNGLSVAEPACDVVIRGASAQLVPEPIVLDCNVQNNSLAPNATSENEAVKLQGLREKLVELVKSKAQLQDEESLLCEIGRVETETSNLQAARRVVQAQLLLQKIIDDFPNSPAALRAKSMLEMKQDAAEKNAWPSNLPTY